MIMDAPLREEPPAMITPADISTDFESYATRRSEVFRALVPLRRARRVRMGDLLTVEFENTDTLRIQVQEMVYVERITTAEAVADEVESYARLQPTSHSLVATMLVEIDDPAEIRSTLRELAGIQRSLALQIADLPPAPGLEIPGPDEDPDVPSETVSVHMLRFTLTDEQRDAFRDPTVPVSLVVDHDAYSESAPVAGETRLSLLADLTL
jgi:hypothetical protein